MIHSGLLQQSMNSYRDPGYDSTASLLADVGHQSLHLSTLIPSTCLIPFQITLPSCRHTIAHLAKVSWRRGGKPPRWAGFQVEHYESSSACRSRLWVLPEKSMPSQQAFLAPIQMTHCCYRGCMLVIQQKMAGSGCRRAACQAHLKVSCQVGVPVRRSDQLGHFPSKHVVDDAGALPVVVQARQRCFDRRCSVLWKPLPHLFHPIPFQQEQAFQLLGIGALRLPLAMLRQCNNAHEQHQTWRIWARW
jgi:hypothetical protein